MLSKVRKDKIVVDRSDLIEAGLAELPLDVVLDGETEAAVRIKRCVRRRPRCFRGEELRHVRLSRAFLPAVVAGSGIEANEVGCAKRCVGAGQRELHSLVGPDRPTEHLALARILDGTLEQETTVAEALRRDEDPLGVHAVEDVAEAAALLADEGISGNHDIIEEDLRRVVVDHRADGLDGHAGEIAHVEDEGRQSLGGLRAFFVGSRASEQQHEVGVERTRRPDLLTVDAPALGDAFSAGSDPGGLGARARLRDTEGLEPQRAVGDAGEVALLLLRTAVPQQRSHDIHLRVAGGGVATRGGDLLEDDRRFGQRGAATAELLGDQSAQIASLGERGHELLGVGVRLQAPPVGPVEGGADLPDTGSQVVEFGFLGQHHPPFVSLIRNQNRRNP